MEQADRPSRIFKLTLKLSPDLRKRLGIEAADRGVSHSKVVAELVDAHLQLPADLKQFAAGLEKPPRRLPPRRLPPLAGASKTDDSQGKNTSLYLPAETWLRLHCHTLKTGEDRMSIVIHLIDRHIVPWATYDPRTHDVFDRRTHHAHEGRSRSPAYAKNTGKLARKAG
jgi:predicted DNA-binding protein